MDKPIAYEPHPVSPERKAELLAGGFKIMDIAHKPAGVTAKPVAVKVEEETEVAVEEAEIEVAPKAVTGGAKRKGK